VPRIVQCPFDLAAGVIEVLVLEVQYGEEGRVWPKVGAEEERKEETRREEKGKDARVIISEHSGLCDYHRCHPSY
jgi:hypothetical protein